MSENALGKADGSTGGEDKESLVDCPSCPRSFKSNAGLTYHLNNDKNDCSGKECPTCGKNMLSWHGVKMHHSSIHNEYIGGVECECDTCGTVFRRPKSLQEKFENTYCCLECQPGLTGEDNPRWKGGKENYYGPNWREQRRKARGRDNYTCQDCGVDESELDRQLDVHHIRRIAWFKEEYGKPEWYELGNALDNLISLCGTCHHKWEGVPLRPDNR